MAGRGNPFSQNNPTSDNFESSFCPDPNTHKSREHLFVVENQVINDMRIHTRAYVKNIGGLPIIPDLPGREYKKKDLLFLHIDLGTKHQSHQRIINK